VAEIQYLPCSDRDHHAGCSWYDHTTNGDRYCDVPDFVATVTD